MAVRLEKLSKAPALVELAVGCLAEDPTDGYLFARNPHLMKSSDSYSQRVKMGSPSSARFSQPVRAADVLHQALSARRATHHDPLAASDATSSQSPGRTESISCGLR
jgi:hypothetical protein